MLKIRLRRMGARNRPYYRVVVSDSRKTPTAASVEEIGHYDPVQDPPVVSIDRERVDHWVGLGAQVSPTVKSLLVRGAAAGGTEAAVPAPAPTKAAKATEATEAAEAAETVEAAEAAKAAETVESTESAESA